MKKMYMLTCFALLLTACTKVPVQKEFDSLQKSIHARTGARTEWQSLDALQKDRQLTEDAQHGLSRSAACALALYNNTELQVALEDLGIAKSDLVQAGFFTNPHLDSVFYIPKKGAETKTEIEIDFRVFTLSDLWLVPVKKQLAEDDLQIKTTDIIETMLHVMLQTHNAYDRCVWEQHNVALLKSMVETLQKTIERFELRKEHGYASVFTISLAKTHHAQVQAQLIDHFAAYKKALLQLTYLLGLDPLEKHIVLTESYKTLPKTLTLPLLEKEALALNPRMQIAELMHTRAEHELSKAKAEIFDDVTLGIGYKREFSGVSGPGPAFGIRIPLFNQNSGAIEAAHYAIAKAEKYIRHTQRTLMTELREAYVEHKALQKQMQIYLETVLPSTNDALTYADTYAGTMELNMVYSLETQARLLEEKMKLAELHYKHALVCNTIEHILGTDVETLA